MFNVTFISAFAAGIVTFLAPCTFVTIPYFIAFIASESFDLSRHTEVSYRLKIISRTLLYIIGFLSVFVLIGSTASSLGRILLQNNDSFKMVGGVLILLFGITILFGGKINALNFLLRERKINNDKLSFKNSNFFPLVLGITSAFAWTPCVGPILGSILYLASVSSSTPMEGALLLLTYGAGIMLPFLLFSVFIGYSEKWVRKFKRYSAFIYKFSGVLLILIGIGLLTGFSDVFFKIVYRFFTSWGYRAQ